MAFLVPAMAELLVATPGFEEPDLRSLQDGVDRQRAARAADAARAAAPAPRRDRLQLVRHDRGRPRVHRDAQGGGHEAHRVGRQADRPDGAQDRARRRLRVRPARGRRAAHPHARTSARVLQGRGRDREHLDRGRLAAQRRPRVPRRGRVPLHRPAARRTSSSGAATTSTRPTSRRCCSSTPTSRRPRSSASRTRCSARTSPPSWWRSPGHDLDVDALLAFCAERLADYKRPRQVHVVDELPRNATGKVMKHRLEVPSG